MKFLIVGLGSIGKRHILNLKRNGIKNSNISGVDPRIDRINETKKIHDIEKCYKNLNEIKNFHFDAAIICSPTSLHISQAIILANNKVNIFIEKPLNHNLNKVDTFKKIVKKNKLKVLITYPFRFSRHGMKLKEVVKENKLGKVLFFRGQFSEYLPDWHPYEDYRKFYMAKKELGGGSILDQSHLIDMCHFLFGEAKEILGCFNSRVSNLKVNTDDIVNMIIKFKNGIVGNIHQDMIGRSHKKNIEIICENGSILWNVYSLSVEIYNAKLKKTKKFSYGKNHNLMYESQTKHMLEILSRKVKPKISLEDGIHTMKIISAAIKSNKLKKAILV